MPPIKGNPLLIDFGYYPEPLELSVGDITISTRDDLATSVDNVTTWPSVEGWIYAPGSRRIFGLPFTHTITHRDCDGPEHAIFLIWVLSFFSGIRLTSTEAGFVDATPIVLGTLHDFNWRSTRDYKKALILAESYWRCNCDDIVQITRWEAAVHAMLIAQYPRSMQYERFIYLYNALDACYCLLKNQLKKTTGGKIPHVGHSSRIDWMCHQFEMPVPPWASIIDKKTEIGDIRNTTIHEGIYMGRPLGFALHDGGSAQNLPLEMRNLVCRFLVALIGAPQAEYVRAPVTSYQTQGLNL